MALIKKGKLSVLTELSFYLNAPRIPAFSSNIVLNGWSTCYWQVKPLRTVVQRSVRFDSEH